MEYVLKTDNLTKKYRHFTALDGIDVGRLFERFYTVESARNSTGLGLSIARSLVERMGGIISADYSMNILCIRITFKKE